MHLLLCNFITAQVGAHFFGPLTLNATPPPSLSRLPSSRTKPVRALLRTFPCASCPSTTEEPARWGHVAVVCPCVLRKHGLSGQSMYVALEHPVRWPSEPHIRQTSPQAFSDNVIFDRGAAVEGGRAKSCSMLSASSSQDSSLSP